MTVLPECGCCDTVDVGLTQDSLGSCYSEVAAAPAATFSEGAVFAEGGFVSGPVFSTGGFVGGGGGIATGGGVASGVSGLRLLAVGGIATAIAVGVSDDDEEASPTN